MKNVRLYLLLSLIFQLQTIKAQIVLNGRPLVNQIECNRSRLGSIDINIIQKNPPYSFIWNTGQLTEKIDGLEAGEYIVKITDAIGADTTLNFNIAERECQLTPEIFFTPNGDGINDTWGISYAQYFDNCLILVYNKLGQKVFEFSGEYKPDNGWDGTDLFGKPLPTASYFFLVYSDKSNREKLRKGTVSIIR